MKTNLHFWSYIAQFFLEWENVSNKSCRENQNTHFVSNNLLSKIVPLWDNVEKYCIAGQATDVNIAHGMLDT